MAKNFKIEKLKITEDILRTPECIDCFERIANHANGVLGSLEVRSGEIFDNLEVRSDELSDHFEHKTGEAIVQIGTKTDDAISSYLKNQEIKHDKNFNDHLEYQDIKYDKFLDKKGKRDVQMFYFILFILTLFGSVIAYGYQQQSNTKEKIIIMQQNIDTKPSRKEIPTMFNLKVLTELGDKYNRVVYVRKEQIMGDTSQYYWTKINIYGPADFYKADYDSVKTK